MEIESKGWHESKITVLGIIFSMFCTVGAVIWQGATITAEMRGLPTRSEYTELNARIITLEVQQSEQGKILQKLELTLDKVNETIRLISEEQQRRTTILRQTEKFMESHK